MPAVSLTTFIDFVSATGTARLTRVRTAKAQYSQDWDPARDFYKLLRDRIHKCAAGGWSADRLKKLLADVTDPKKQENYETCRAGIVKWAGKGSKTVRPYPNSGKVLWQSGTLQIRVNPELLVRDSSGRRIVKLYFKSDPLSQQKAHLILHLLDQTVGSKAEVGVLDVRRGKLFVPTKPFEGLDALLSAEAAAFTTLWEKL